MNNVRIAITTLFLTCLMVGGCVALPSKSAYLDGGASTSALILLHGRGQSPTWKVVNPLRKDVHSKLGLHTLSLQMPNADKPWKDYAQDFPQAYTRILQGIRYLRDERKVTTIYLMGHSMGGRMASAFLAKYPEQKIAGLIVVGCRNNGDFPLSCKESLRHIDIPVLDIWGSKSKKDAYAAHERVEFVSDNYQQVEILGVDHRFNNKGDELSSSVINWLHNHHTR